MTLYEQILSKKEIQSRFNTAIYAILKNRLISSKTSLAESLGIKPSKFSEILNDRMGVGVDLAAKICDEYYVSPEWLLMGRGKRVFCETKNRSDYWIDDYDLIEDPAADMLEQKDFPFMSDISGTLYNKTLEQAELIGTLKARIKNLKVSYQIKLLNALMLCFPDISTEFLPIMLAPCQADVKPMLCHVSFCHLKKTLQFHPFCRASR